MDPAPGRAYAGLVSRLAALVIDVGLLMVTTLGVGTLPGLAWQQLTLRPAPGWVAGGSGLVAVLLPWTYFTALWWLTGQTLGDLVTGVVVRRAGGEALSLPQAGVRAAAGLLLAPLWLVGFVGVLGDERRRAWHDRLFRTVVRYAPPRPVQARPVDLGRSAPPVDPPTR